jgi:hypothetical protein
MRLLLISLVAVCVGVSVGCSKEDSYKTRSADPEIESADPGDLIPEDPAMSGDAPAEGSEAKPAEGSEAKPAEGSEAKPAEGSEAKPEAPAEKE